MTKEGRSNSDFTFLISNSGICLPSCISFYLCSLLASDFQFSHIISSAVSDVADVEFITAVVAAVLVVEVVAVVAVSISLGGNGLQSLFLMTIVKSGAFVLLSKLVQNCLIRSSGALELEGHALYVFIFSIRMADSFALRLP